jgi:hypothetical protein
MNKMNLINNGWVFVYQGQKVHVFCPSLSFLAEAQLELGNKTRNLLFAIQLLSIHFDCDHNEKHSR